MVSGGWAWSLHADGTVANTSPAGVTPEQKTPADNLVELRGTAIRQGPGECPAKP